MIFILIYKITNTINNKIYVGKTTTSLKQRFNEHCKFAKLNKHSTHLANAIRKYGKENFKIEKIDEANSISELNLKEKYWIKSLDAVNSGYNLTAGGDGGNTYECKTDEEMNDIKNKIRESKMSGDNPHSKLVKCKNVITNEEIFLIRSLTAKNILMKKAITLLPEDVLIVPNMYMTINGYLLTRMMNL